MFFTNSTRSISLLSFLAEHGFGDVRLFRIVDPVQFRMFPFAAFSEASDVPLPNGFADGIYKDGITHELSDGFANFPF